MDELQLRVSQRRIDRPFRSAAQAAEGPLGLAEWRGFLRGLRRIPQVAIYAPLHHPKLRSVHHALRREVAGDEEGWVEAEAKTEKK